MIRQKGFNDILMILIFLLESCYYGLNYLSTEWCGGIMSQNHFLSTPCWAKTSEITDKKASMKLKIFIAPYYLGSCLGARAESYFTSFYGRKYPKNNNFERHGNYLEFYSTAKCRWSPLALWENGQKSHKRALMLWISQIIVYRILIKVSPFPFWAI